VLAMALQWADHARDPRCMLKCISITNINFEKKSLECDTTFDLNYTAGINGHIKQKG